MLLNACVPKLIHTNTVHSTHLNFNLIINMFEKHQSDKIYLLIQLVKHNNVSEF